MDDNANALPWSERYWIAPINASHHELRAYAAAPQSDMAREVLKDPYTFNFLTLGDVCLVAAGVYRETVVPVVDRVTFRVATRLNASDRIAPVSVGGVR